MIYLRTLGTLDLRHEEGRAVGSVLAQPKRFALLAFLALSPGFQRRDSLLGLFWPEASEEAARASLRTALSVLRRSLGEGVVVGRGNEEIGVDPDRLWCDVVAFEQAIAADRLEESLELYRGDLLEGFYIPEAAGFEHWLEQRRAELRRKAAGAAGRLVARAEEQGRLEEAARWARLGIKLAVDDEGALRRLLALLDRMGDRAGALRAYELFAERLRQEYQVDPCPETQALIAAIRVRTSVPPLVAKLAELPPLPAELPALPAAPTELPPRTPLPDTGAVEERIDEPARLAPMPPDPRPEEPGSEPLPAGWRRRTPVGLRLRTVASTALALVLLVAALLHLPARQPSHFAAGSAIPASTGTAPVSSIAVLPFVDMSADRDQEHLADGMAEEIINALVQVDGLRVVARTSAFAFKGSDTDVREIGRLLGVQAVLEGSVRKSANRVRITAQLVSAENGYHLWSETFERELSDLFAIQDDISRSITRALTGRFFARGQLRNAHRVPDNLVAYDHYLRGLHFQNHGSVEGLQKAAAHFEQAIAADSTYALAYAGLSDTYITYPTLGILPNAEAHALARAAALRALELDETLADAHAALARTQLEGDWDFAGAGRSYARAIALNPRFVLRVRYAFHLVTIGQMEEAIEVLQQTAALDPISVVARSRLGLILYFDGRYEQAIEQLRRALELAPSDPFAHWYLGLVYMQQRRFDDAIEAIRTAVALSGGSPLVRATLGSAYARAGRRADALEIRDELLNGTSQLYLRPQGMVFLLSDLGERDEAFRWLEAAVADRSMLPFVLTSEPLLNPLRQDPRFRRLLAREGLPHRGWQGRAHTASAERGHAPAGSWRQLAPLPPGRWTR